MGEQVKVTGHEAIEMSESTGAELCKYADPIEGARVVTLDEAREIAAIDPSLIYALIEE